MVKNPPVNTEGIRDAGSIPGSGRSPGGENGYPLQYFCLDNFMDRGAWWAAIHRVTKRWTWLKWFSMHTWWFLSLKPNDIVCGLVTQLCLTLCNSMDCILPGSSVHGDSPGKNTGVGCHTLLQGIFPTQQATEPKSPMLQADSLLSEPPGLQWIHLGVLSTLTFLYIVLSSVGGLLIQSFHSG